MEKVISILVLTFFLSNAFSQGVKKDTYVKADSIYTVTFHHKEWDDILMWISVAQSRLLNSDIPSKDVKVINDSLTAIQQRFINQIKPQLPKEEKK